MAKQFPKAEGKRVSLSKQQQKEIKSMYEGVRKELSQSASKLKGKDNISSSLRSAYLKDLSKELAGNIKELNAEIEGKIESNMLDVANAVVEENQSMLQSMGLDIKGAYSHVPKDVVEQIMSGTLYEGKWSLSSAIWGDSQKTIKDIDLIISRGIAANKSAYDIAKDLEKYVEPGARKPWEWSKVYPTSKKIIDYNAQRLARTMVSHAYQESFVRATKDNPFFTGYKWLPAHSDRVCPLCRERAETDQFDMGAGIFPKDQLPLDHPNGMCTFAAVMTKSMDEVVDDIANWYHGTGNQDLNSQIDKFVETMKNK